jgi:hypothetical protein
VGKRDTCSDRNVTAYDAMPAEQAQFAREKVHGSAFSSRATVSSTEQLRHTRIDIHPYGESNSVIAVCGDDAVLAYVDDLGGTGRHRFLTDVQVQESGYLLLAVHLRGAFFEPPLQQHIPVDCDDAFLAQSQRRVVDWLLAERYRYVSIVCHPSLSVRFR